MTAINEDEATYQVSIDKTDSSDSQCADTTYDIVIESDEEATDTPSHDLYEDSIDILMTTESVIHEYFSSINDVLQKFSHYNAVSRNIDYVKLRRFLMTTYNTLVDLDLDLKKTRIRDVLKDINDLSDVYDSFRQTSKQSKRAFYDLFLSRHDDFTKAQKQLESNKLAITKHNSNIQIAETSIEKLKNLEATTPPTSANYPIIQQRIKKGRSIASDEIHRKRELEEENKQLVQFIDMIINENEESFTQKYIPQAKIYNQKITDLLNKVAYTFDASLWKIARDSKPIKEHFRESTVKGKLSSLTYLKYYLQSLSNDKLSDDQRELTELVPYLETLHRRSLLYFSAEVENALRLKSIASSLDKYIEIETTLHYDKAVESVMKKIPDFIFIDHELSDLKLLLKTLRISGIIQNTNIVLVVENASASFLEQVKKINIRYLLPLQGSNHLYLETLTRILDEDEQ